MPIHVSWKSEFLGMKKQYCGKSTSGKEYEFSDGTKVTICKKGANVFFASLNKMGADDTKPRPATINETIFNETASQILNELIEWAVRRG